MDRLNFKGFGKSNPIEPNNSGENRKLNRRVEIVLKLRDDIKVQQVSPALYLNNGEVIPVKEYILEEVNFSYLQYGSTYRKTEPLGNVNYIVGTDGTRKYENPMAGMRKEVTLPNPTPVPPPKEPVVYRYWIQVY